MRLVEVKGKDSADFLHRVTAGTVKSVQPGEGRPGLLLTGQSKMIAQFDLLRLAPDRFLLATPEPCARALADGLEALHFSESLEIALTGQKVGAEERSGSTREEGKSFSMVSEGSDLSWSSPVPGYVFSTQAEGTPAHWSYDRIAALYPQPPHDWTDATPALEAGVLPFIDRFKGCYPGQEVVELSLNVGHPARILISVASGEPFKEKVQWDGAELPVTSAAEKEGRYAALVRVPWGKRDFLPEGFTRLKSHW